MSPSQSIAGFRIDKRVARLNALWVTIALGAFLVLGRWWILAFLFLDFLLRGFFRGRMSPIAALSRSVVASFHLRPQPQWGAPKIFAAKLGCVFSLAALLVLLAGADEVAKILCGCFIILTSLEAFGGYCVGCQIHTALYRVRTLRGVGPGTPG